MELPQNIQHQIAQFQQVQQQAQAISMQKQSVELQIKETQKALDELKKVEDDSDVYKTAGNLLVKVKKDDITAELEEKVETLELREKTVKRQEERIMGVFTIMLYKNPSLTTQISSREIEEFLVLTS